MQRGVLRGIAVFRWGAWAWMTVVLTLNRDELRRPWVAWALVSLALAFTGAATLLAERDPDRLVAAPTVLTELALGAALNVAGGWAYASGDAFSSVHSLGSAWPLAGVLTAGVAWGITPAAFAGLAIGAARFAAPFANGLRPSELTGSNWFSLASSTLLSLLAGAVTAHLSNLLRRAEREVSTSRAREEVARALHDGVLQTLAVIERRADNPDLARLAREQERDLRAFLFGGGPTAEHGGAADVGPALRAAAARFEDAFGGRADVVLAPDLPPLDAKRAGALAGAVGEALVNAGKHGGASRVTVYAEPDESGRGVLCSVRDDGSGFDTSTVAEGVGISRSIRGRVEDAGGSVEIDSRPGAGTEVRLWLP